MDVPTSASCAIRRFEHWMHWTCICKVLDTPRKSTVVPWRHARQSFARWVLWSSMSNGAAVEFDATARWRKLWTALREIWGSLLEGSVHVRGMCSSALALLLASSDSEPIFQLQVKPSLYQDKNKRQNHLWMKIVVLDSYLSPWLDELRLATLSLLVIRWWPLKWTIANENIMSARSAYIKTSRPWWRMWLHHTICSLSGPITPLKAKRKTSRRSARCSRNPVITLVTSTSTNPEPITLPVQSSVQMVLTHLDHKTRTHALVGPGFQKAFSCFGGRRLKESPEFKLVFLLHVEYSE